MSLSSNITYLGVVIDEKLSFKTQITDITLTLKLYYLYIIQFSVHIYDMHVKFGDNLKPSVFLTSFHFKIKQYEYFIFAQETFLVTSCILHPKIYI